jgi:hypothetical protein
MREIRGAPPVPTVKDRGAVNEPSMAPLRPAISILDSFPVPVCRFGRAWRCQRLAELASFGRDEGAKQTYLWAPSPSAGLPARGDL